MKQLSFAALLLLVLASCTPEKDKRPDLTVPPMVQLGFDAIGNPATLILKYESEPCFIQQNYCQFGAAVTIYGTTQNEYFSLRRYDSVNHQFVVFYWTHYSPTAFNDTHPNPVFHAPQKGETITVYKFVFNQSDNAEAYAPASEANTTVVKVENGKAEEVSQKVATPPIAPGGYGVVATPYVYQGQGIYNITVTADATNVVVEKVEDNNTGRADNVQNLTN
ncbi:MAG: hypothetical protein EBZ77_10900 [Chitinophagia bacterium]|nr:hypothetical protein [Chitinophagia bacterium]